MFTVTKYIYLLACILVVWSIYVLEKWNGLERWLRGAFEMFPQNNHQAEIFFFPLRVILNLSLPYHTSWCKHFVAIVFFFFNGCHLTSIFYFSFLDYLNVISFLPKVPFSQVRVYFVKVSVFLNHSLVRPNGSLKTCACTKTWKSSTYICC